MLLSIMPYLGAPLTHEVTLSNNFEEVFTPIMEETGLKLLTIGFSQWRGLSKDVELKTPEDFRKVKIRVMENNYHIAF